MYLLLVIQEAKYKNDYLNNSKKGGGYLSHKIIQDIKDIEETSILSIDEFVKIEAYRNCNHAN